MQEAGVQGAMMDLADKNRPSLKQRFVALMAQLGIVALLRKMRILKANSQAIPVLPPGSDDEES